MTQTTAPSPAVVRHAVYSDLVGMLPHASIHQAEKFIGNLALCREALNASGHPIGERRNRIIDACLIRFIGLRVTPDAAEIAGSFFTGREIVDRLNAKFGETLRAVPGFAARDQLSAFSFQFPRNAAVYAYMGETRHIAGLLFQPLDRQDQYWLASSRKYGGPGSAPLNSGDARFFDQAAEPPTPIVLEDMARETRETCEKGTVS